MSEWTAADVPDQSGRTVLITGANSGIGLEAARVFVEKGAHVVLACRSREKAEVAEADIEASSASGGGSTEILDLDLGDLDSVRSAAENFLAEHDRLDVLVNNAGLMATPKRLTPQGVEVQFGVNHLGHFALTGLLLDTLSATGTDETPSRVVNIASLAHRSGTMDFENLDASVSYHPWRAYGRSKLANLLFTRELDERVTAAGLPILSVAAHPGGSSTNLGNEPAGDALSRVLGFIRPVFDKFMTQSAAMGALPTLMAAVDPAAEGGDYYGPGGMGEFRGHPEKVGMAGRAKDESVASELWTVSVDLSGVDYLT